MKYYIDRYHGEKELAYIPYGQAKIREHDDGRTDLISYKTRVVTISPAGWLECSGLYSNTTRRHISAFLRECAPGISYQTVKQCFFNDMKINIFTADVAPIWAPEPAADARTA